MNRYIPLTDDEFDMVRVALADTIQDFKNYAEMATNEEDELVERVYLDKLLALQSKFPDPNEPINLK